MKREAVQQFLAVFRGRSEREEAACSSFLFLLGLSGPSLRVIDDSVRAVKVKQGRAPYGFPT